MVNVIVDHVKEVGEVYNTTGFAFYFYGLMKMIKPKLILELGTGYGATSFFAAHACKENAYGKVITYDDGSDWEEPLDYDSYINKKIVDLQISEYIDFRKEKVDLINIDKKLISLEEVSVIFNDVNVQPVYFFSLLAFLLPRTNKESYLIIDRAATFWPTYCALELTINNLNYGKIPKFMYQFIEDEDTFKNKLNKYKFSTQYIKKNTISDQDSFAVIKIEEYDIQ